MLSGSVIVYAYVSAAWWGWRRRRGGEGVRPGEPEADVIARWGEPDETHAGPPGRGEGEREHVWWARGGGVWVVRVDAAGRVLSGSCVTGCG